MSTSIEITIYSGKAGQRTGHTIKMGRNGERNQMVLVQMLEDQPGIRALAETYGHHEIDFAKLRKRLKKDAEAMIAKASDVSLMGALRELRDAALAAPKRSIAFATVRY